MQKNKETKNEKPGSGRPCVYILKCGDGTLYTGWTNDFDRRLAAHNAGKGAKYTRGRGPLTPVYLEYLPDKVSATKREAAIKKLARAKKIRLLDSPGNSYKDYIKSEDLNIQKYKVGV